MEQVNRDELERAAKRIMEMNSRANMAVSRKKPQQSAPQRSDNTAGRHERADGTPAGASPARKPQEKMPLFNLINFKNIVGDSDRTLLAGIMMLLGGEKADEKLMLALLYIML